MTKLMLAEKQPSSKTSLPFPPETDAMIIDLPEQFEPEGPLWRYSSPDHSVDVYPPRIEIDGESVTLGATLRPHGSVAITSKIQEHTYSGDVASGLSLSLVARIADNNPVVRFRYELKSGQRRLMTKSGGLEHVDLLRVGVTAGATEVRLSDYNSMIHSYVPTEAVISASDFENSCTFMGPLLVWPTSTTGNALLAYEHGSQYPDSYLSFKPDASISVTLSGVKGTYLNNTDLRSGFQSVWMHVGAASGPRSILEKSYRDFIHYFQAVSQESRKPYIYYNTWNHQERIHFWEQRSYLADMTEKRMLDEIEIAHQFGAEVFVLDTGWYDATGDWRVSSERFPNGLKPLNELLNQYGMKLGLWFGPTTAALSSNLYARNLKNRLTWKGELHPTRKIWETEESAEICLVSSYAADFAQELIRCAETFGVRYFKWDAIDQYGCDDPCHDHGDESHTQEERADRYAFCQPLAMVKIVETLCAAYPDAIVDFDVTEYDRCFGLAFLSVGKYFLINNGSYIHNYDVPRTKDVTFRNNSLFFYPGPARDWVMRTPYSFDTWIPSVLFLVHYLPDDGPTNQNMTAASLVLGHNGIWGDLIGISASGVGHLKTLLAPYKQVRDDAASVAAFATGGVGSMIETYEKINPHSGKGLVSIFGNVTMQSAWGRPLTMRQPLVAKIATLAKPSRSVWHTPNVKVRFDATGHASMTATFTGSDAALVYFGVG